MTRLRARIVLTLVMLLPWAAPADANVLVDNLMMTDFATVDPGLAIYEYGSGSDQSADFATGTHTATTEVGGALELDFTAGSNGWWNAAWTKRQCFSVSSAQTESEYPIRLVVDTSLSSSAADDIRVVSGTSGTVLDTYVEGPVPSASTVVWAQAEPLAAGTSTFCVYFDNAAAPSVSDEVATFSYTTRAIKYYTLSNEFFGSGADSRVTVISYSNNNTVSDGTTTVVLSAGQTHTFTHLNQHSTITATGPIDASYDRDSKDALIPEGHADAQFAFATRRYQERFWIRSPHGSTTVEAISNGVVIASVNVSPADGSVMLNAAGPGSRPVSLRTTNGLDIVATHVGTNGQDTLNGVPWFGDTVYGVASQTINFGALSPTTVSWIRSNGVSNASQSVSISALMAIGSNGARGNGRAYAVSGSTYFSAAQQADADGTESTAFLPKRLLSQTYRLPISARYYTIACPIVGTMISINGGAPSACNGTGVGHYYSGLGTQAAGTLIEADAPVFVYYESSSNKNETNLYGPKASIPYTASVSMSPGPVENVSLCGVWESDPLPGHGVYGQVSIDDAVPADTTATYLMSIDGGPFVGPDGTAATSYVEGDIVPYLVDQAATVRLQVELCSADGHSTPTVSDFSLEADLKQILIDVTNTASLSVPSPITGSDGPLWRIYQRNGGAWAGHLESRGGTNLAALRAVFRTDHPTIQVSVASGPAVDSGVTYSNTTAEPYSVFVSHDTNPGQTASLEVAVVAEGDVRVESGIDITFIG